MTYAPLQFVEQTGTIFKGNDQLNGFKCEDEMNENHRVFMGSFFKIKDNREKFILDFFLMRDEMMKRDKFPKGAEEWSKTKTSYLKYVIPKHLCSSDSIISDLDFLEFMMQSCISEDWKYHKLTYKVTPKLAYDFCNMELPKDIKNHTVTKFPAECFYIDLSSGGEEICQDIEGIFVDSSIGNFHDKKILCIELLAIIRGKHGHLMPVFDQLLKGYDEDDDDYADVKIVKSELNAQLPEFPITFEDGVSRVFSVEKLHSFFFNFLVYLQAANRDVEKSKESEATFKKPIDKTKEPKNKYKELRQYEVGYKISSPYPKKKVGTSTVNTGTGSPKSSHYRAAHWHHYWTGSKENKQLVVKWVEGIFVNGKAEQNIAVVHNVK